MTGEHFTALVLNKTVAVSGTTIKITLQPVEGTRAIISAIEVFEIIPAEMKTLIQEVTTLRTLKGSLGLPLRFGWNGDPCVPQQHPWSGVDCQFDGTKRHWVIDGLGLDNQGLRGVIPSDISKLQHLQSMNPVGFLLLPAKYLRRKQANVCCWTELDGLSTGLSCMELGTNPILFVNVSGNSIEGNIPFSLGTISGMRVLYLSYNELNGSIPESLGQLTSLDSESKWQ